MFAWADVQQQPGQRFALGKASQRLLDVGGQSSAQGTGSDATDLTLIIILILFLTAGIEPVF